MSRSLIAALIAVLVQPLLGPVAAAPETPPHAGDAFAAYRSLSVQNDGVAVDGRELRIGNMTMRFAQGGLFPVRGGGGQLLGALFVGRGRYTYASVDPGDQATFKSNVANVTTKLDPTTNTVNDAYDRALILLAGDVIDRFLDTPWDQLPKAAPPPSLASDLDAFQKKLALSDLEFDHYAASILGNGPPDRYAYVEIEGDLETIGYEYDAHRSWFERVFTFRKFFDYEYRFRETMSRQAIEGRDKNLVDLMLVDADIAVATPDNRSGTVTTDMTVEVVRERLQIATFALANNRDPDSVRWQSDKNALRVSRVVDGEGRELPFSHRYNEVAVDLGRPHARGDKLKLRFETAGEVFTGPDGHRHDEYFDLYFINWFPQPLGYASSRFTFRLSVETAKPFRPLASGDTVELSEDGPRFLLRTKSDVPVKDIAVFAGKYKVKELKLDWITVRGYAYAMAREDDLEALVNMTALFSDIYRAVFGPLPYKELELVEVPTFLMYGISPPGVIILTSPTFKPRDEWVLKIFGNRGANSLVAHEVAHQWFGHLAWPADPTLDNWLSESLAEYSAGLAMAVAEKQAIEKGQKVRKGMIDFEDMLVDWRSWADMAAGHGSIRTANRLAGDLAGEYRYYQLYCRGPLVLHMFRSLIGDDRYVAVMRRYIEDANTGATTTARFVKAVNEVLRLDFGWYFDQWLERSGIPEIKVEHAVEESDGKVFLTGTVSQSEAPVYKIHVPFVIELPGGKRIVKLVFQEQARQTFRLELPARPVKVSVDPGRNNLARYR